VTSGANAKKADPSHTRGWTYVLDVQRMGEDKKRRKTGSRYIWKNRKGRRGVCTIGSKGNDLKRYQKPQASTVREGLANKPKKTERVYSRGRKNLQGRKKSKLSELKPRGRSCRLYLGQNKNEAWNHLRDGTSGANERTPFETLDVKGGEEQQTKEEEIKSVTETILGNISL